MKTLFLAAFLILTGIAAMGAEEISGFGDWGGLSVLAARRVAVISAEVGQTVTKIRYRMGESFVEGDELVTFNDIVPQANLEAARAARGAAEAEFHAVESMFGKNNSSRVELENARRNLVQAEARLKLAEYELSCCVIRAPFSGRVADTLVNEFELVQRGTKILALVDDTVLVSRLLMPEEMFGKIAPGAKLTIDLPMRGIKREATVTNVAAVFDPASRTFDVWAELDNSDGLLRAGMTASLVEAAP